MNAPLIDFIGLPACNRPTPVIFFVLHCKKKYFIIHTDPARVVYTKGTNRDLLGCSTHAYLVAYSTEQKRDVEICMTKICSNPRTPPGTPGPLNALHSRALHVAVFFSRYFTPPAPNKTLTLLPSSRSGALSFLRFRTTADQ